MNTTKQRQQHNHDGIKQDNRPITPSWLNYLPLLELQVLSKHRNTGLDTYWLHLICSHGLSPVKLIIIYRPPYSRAHPISIRTFLKELTDYLESVILCRDSILITGDINIHVDDPTNDESLKFLDLLESMGLEQHVNEPTHTYGHTLDLVITMI